MQGDFRIEEIQAQWFISDQALVPDIFDGARGSFDIAVLAQDFRCTQPVMRAVAAAAFIGQNQELPGGVIKIAVACQLFGAARLRVVDARRDSTRRTGGKSRSAG